MAQEQGHGLILHPHRFLYGIFLLLSLSLSACGGGSSGIDSTSEEDPNSLGDGSTPNESDNGNTNPEEGDTTDSDCQMTPGEEVMLQQVNSARLQTRDCGSTTYSAVAPLKWDCKLQKAALVHSLDMANNNFLNHTGSNGLGPEFRIEEQGYQVRTWGENIAAGYTNVVDAIAAWLESSGHCQNIMNPKVTDLGMASAENSNSDYRIYWTQVFAQPAATN